ncbi:F0F1 ATP synthase subunit A [Georgenia deserti]|uniref:ATP synthase subunit a n=1 Tax=Georgenia deserti TaxID=2093781 RepID=A0ABW4L0M7_9MICO
MMLQSSVLASDNGGFHAPSLADFFPPAIFAEGTMFEFNRVTLVRLIAVAALVLFFWLAARRTQLVPGRMQAVGEIAIDFVRKSIAVETLGEDRGRRYTPLLATIFFGVLFLNITGVIPFLNLAGSSVVGIPIVFAVIAYVAFIRAGIKERGPGHFFKDQLFPPGVPWPIYILLTPLELFSTFILRPVTLTVRLLANMIAGHLLLVLCFGATHYLFLEAGGPLALFGVITGLGGLAFTLLEIFIASLQAYIFALLTAVYIQLSVEAH